MLVCHVNVTSKILSALLFNFLKLGLAASVSIFISFMLKNVKLVELNLIYS